MHQQARITFAGIWWEQNNGWELLSASCMGFCHYLGQREARFLSVFVVGVVLVNWNRSRNSEEGP